MPLFHQIGQPEDATYLYDENPDPSRFTEVTAPAAAAPAAPSTPSTPEVPVAPAPDAPATPADGTQPKE